MDQQLTGDCSRAPPVLTGSSPLRSSVRVPPPVLGRRRANHPPCTRGARANVHEEHHAAVPLLRATSQLHQAPAPVSLPCAASCARTSNRLAPVLRANTLDRTPSSRAQSRTVTPPAPRIALPPLLPPCTAPALPPVRRTASRPTRHDAKPSSTPRRPCDNSLGPRPCGHPVLARDLRDEEDQPSRPGDPPSVLAAPSLATRPAY
ncbi:hypothetical protein E2562_027867 [Oryza meyeriana var. granulata]|uniref:Uncharacterized protein n=1 Tax=Oryza meyeriana var. granulata TaxID=110450 RepID=A0A6G1CU72_9ORYZ|nr:hypothetical protein E2562_027867 [Oryza meyeriana var. granulata]